jgi:acyl-coenzyme A synthetase/AMP-(fatty) acid ligase
MNAANRNTLKRELASIATQIGGTVELTLLDALPRTSSGKIDRRAISGIHDRRKQLAKISA